jgi:hypothetical protein
MEEAMLDDKLVSRREFSVASALAILAGVVITVIDCGSGSSTSSSPTPVPTPTPTPNASGDKVGVISSNHGHVAVITAARLASPASISLDIRGQATHSHTVDLTAAEITAIAGNQQVSKPSTTDEGHSHTVTFN